jgi:hypothetical protein
MFIHVSHALHNVGDVIEPGAFGRSVRQWSKNKPTDSPEALKNVIWESALESVRMVAKPEAPSRLACVFACRSQADATRFRDRFRVGAGLYAIEPAPPCPTFFGDYDLITDSSFEPFVDHFSQRSVRYWTQEASGMCEVLIGGPVKVMQRLWQA